MTAEVRTNYENGFQDYGNIRLVPEFQRATPSELRERSGVFQPLFGLDFLMEFPQRSERVEADGILLGFRYGDVASIDHHTPVPEMERIISTTPLAQLYTKTYGVIPADTKIIINHLDTDSVLSALIIAGLLPQDDPRWWDAARAADHTGEENVIADLLNGIEHKRDMEFSLSCLYQFLKNGEISPEAAIMMKERRDERELVLSLGNIELQDAGNGIYYYCGEKMLRSEFFPVARPDGLAFVVASPSKFGVGYDYKVRAGLRFPQGIALNRIGLPGFGGRWNAGGTLRSKKAITIQPYEYAQLVGEKIAAA